MPSPRVLAIAAVLFSSELAAAHVPGIWYPWGVGVSLSEYAWVAFVLLLFALLLRRLWAYAGYVRLANRSRISLSNTSDLVGGGGAAGAGGGERFN